MAEWMPAGQVTDLFSGTLVITPAPLPPKAPKESSSEFTSLLKGMVGAAAGISQQRDTDEVPPSREQSRQHAAGPDTGGATSTEAASAPCLAKRKASRRSEPRKSSAAFGSCWRKLTTRPFR